jgi:hypothetical protein
MFSSTDGELIAGIDRVLSRSQLEQSAVGELRQLLYPRDGREQWPDLKIVVYLLDAPSIVDALNSREMHPELAELLLDLMSATAPLLGARPFGPLEQQIAYFRGRYAREQKKYELVAERIGSRPVEEVIPMMMAYLDMEPAPFFLQRLRQRYGAVVTRAEEALEKEAERWRTQENLLALLQGFDGEAETIAVTLRQALEELRSGPLGDLRSVKRGISSGNAEARLVASALATYAGYSDVAPLILAHVLAADAYPLHLAVFSARLDSELTRDGLAAWLIDVVWGNPEEPEAEMTPARREAAMAARAVLPHVGSPLPVLDDQGPAGETAARAQWLFSLWRLVGRSSRP